MKETFNKKDEIFDDVSFLTESSFIHRNVTKLLSSDSKAF